MAQFTAYPRGTFLVAAIAILAVASWVIGFDTVADWVPDSPIGRAAVVIVALILGMYLYGMDPAAVATDAIGSVAG